jgi:hypothetical protein
MFGDCIYAKVAGEESQEDVLPELMGLGSKLPFDPLRVAKAQRNFDSGYIDYEGLDKIVKELGCGDFNPAKHSFFAVARARCGAGREWLQRQLRLSFQLPLHPSAVRRVEAPAGAVSLLHLALTLPLDDASAPPSAETVSKGEDLSIAGKDDSTVPGQRLRGH